MCEREREREKERARARAHERAWSLNRLSRVRQDVFKKHDKARKALLPIRTLYDEVLHVPRTLFCDGLFDMIEATDSEAVDFGEFVAALTTYCFFEIPELLKFCFFVFDRERKHTHSGVRQRSRRIVRIRGERCVGDHNMAVSFF